MTDKALQAVEPGQMTQEQINLIKQTVAKGATDDELNLFLYTAKKTGLDPLLHQIHAVKRWDGRMGKDTMAIQTGIDGYRLIADRTGKYAPGREPSYTQANDKLESATAYIKKLTSDGTWHEVAATAFYSEYVQTTKDGRPNRMWEKMGHVMLAKCAEALALRKAFPAEMAGVYTDEEMTQAEPAPATPPPQRAIEEKAPEPEKTASGHNQVKGFTVVRIEKTVEKTGNGDAMEILRIVGLYKGVEKKFIISSEQAKKAEGFKGKQITLNYISTAAGDFVQ